jgi:hypothetical protein
MYIKKDINKLCWIQGNFQVMYGPGDQAHRPWQEELTSHNQNEHQFRIFHVRYLISPLHTRQDSL